jgi:hypothetical protein
MKHSEKKVTQTFMERMKSNTVQRCAYVLRVGGKTYGLKEGSTGSTEGRKGKGRPERKWGREVERATKQKNLTPEKPLQRPT